VRIAVLSCLGLGDGLISLVLSNNLQKQGHEVTTIHPFLHSLQEWFPHLPIAPRREFSFPHYLNYDKIFLFHEKTTEMLEWQYFFAKNFPEKLIILNPIATLRQDYPFWENGRFDGAHSFVENLHNYCRNSLNIPDATKNNGIVIPSSIQQKKYPHRVVIHPTSSKASKNWTWKKFTALSKKLEEAGWEPYFLLTQEERQKHPPCRTPDLHSLEEMTRFVAESGAMIGNDSGIGHLASCLGLPTVVIFRNQKVSMFWRPGWSEGEVVVPPKWVPNCKWIRWRDRHWQKFISTEKVFRAFSLRNVS
jgi:hypothetical protein